eukprot:284594-Hanusia_phi.AAC.1
MPSSKEASTSSASIFPVFSLSNTFIAVNASPLPSQHAAYPECRQNRLLLLLQRLEGANHNLRGCQDSKYNTHSQHSKNSNFLSHPYIHQSVDVEMSVTLVHRLLVLLHLQLCRTPTSAAGGAARASCLTGGSAPKRTHDQSELLNFDLPILVPVEQREALSNLALLLL